MKIALTGITGFIGQNLMPQLLTTDKDNQFLTINRDVNKAHKLFPLSTYKNFIHISTNELYKLIEYNPDIVIHLATLSTSRCDTEIIRPLLAANIEFGVLLLDALSQCENLKLFVNTGSFAEYRYNPEHLDDAYLYSATKTAFRSFVDFYSHIGHGFRYITAIPYSVYGGNMTIKRLFDYIIESQNAKKPIDMTAGEQVLDFIHVDDVASFYTHIIEHYMFFLTLPENGMEFHLGTGRGTSIREVALLIEEASQRKCNINWGGRPYREQDIMYAVAPVNKNKNCGWKANISLKDGINSFIEKVITNCQNINGIS